jgi:hypothetical protein
MSTAATAYRTGSRSTRIGLIAAAATALIGLVGYDAGVNDRDLLQKDRVDWTVFGLIRPFVAFVAACLLVAGLRPAEARPLDSHQPRGLLGLVYVMAAFLLVATLVVIFAPTILNETVREGQFLSYMTELVFIVALVGLAMAAWRTRDAAPILGLRPRWIIAAMFAVTFLILMEEMSWGQHWIGWSTGAMFEGNAQNETNLHNFATYRFEAAYYSTAFLLFVVLPAIWPSRPAGLLARIERFVPPKLFVLAGLPLAGLLYEEWNVVPYQLWFFMGVLIALMMAREAWSATGAVRAAALFIAVLLPVSQLVFVFGGHRMADGYELSEIREFLISCLIAGYGWWLFASEAKAGAKARQG